MHVYVATALPGCKCLSSSESCLALLYLLLLLTHRNEKDFNPQKKKEKKKIFLISHRFLLDRNVFFEIEQCQKLCSDYYFFDTKVHNVKVREVNYLNIFA